MALSIQRLNMDNSWHLEWDGTRMLIDPWLLGSEIYGGSWFNEQWHATTPLSAAEIPPYDAILITQVYNDHCHLPTLAQLSAQVPVYGDQATCRKLQRHFPDRQCKIISTAIPGEGTTVGKLNCRLWSSGRLLPPVFNTLLITCGNEAIIFAAHGFKPNQVQLAYVRQYKLRLLGATCATISLPALFGGQVNPGLSQVNRLLEQLQPAYLVDTHDEQKHTRGMIMKIARREYPDMGGLSFEDRQVKVLNIRDYEPVII